MDATFTLSSCSADTPAKPQPPAHAVTIEPQPQPIQEEPAQHIWTNNAYGDTDSDESGYTTWSDSDDEVEPHTKEEQEAREAERRSVLEAAGLFVKQDTRAKPPPRPARRKSYRKRRPAPETPDRLRNQDSILSTASKDLPDVPPADEPLDPAAHLDDAYNRYESFRQSKEANRLSVASFDALSSPSSAGIAASPKEEGGRSYSHILSFLGRKTPVEAERRTMPVISAPILNAPPEDVDASRPRSPAFGSSWASVVDKSALEGMPVTERKRQEAIFELINTEVAYVRDLQLIVESFYSSMMPLLDRKGITVVFANIEDILLVNTTFMSDLEERQRDCRLYIDRIGDILAIHMSHMGLYLEYCANQTNAAKLLQSMRASNPELAAHLQRLKEDPTLRNLDLSSYLLIPMQRVTRYPLLIKQVLHYTEAPEEAGLLKEAIQRAEEILHRINEAIRDQEGREKLKSISQNLWIGQGHLDLTAPTRHMGPRKLLKEGILLKAKSGRKLQAFLCSDILVLTDATAKSLYRMPIALSEAQVKEVLGRDDTGFQISLPYPRGGEAISLRATSVRDCQVWIQAIEAASRSCVHAEKRAMRKVRGGSRT